jgi:hypothetical protein
MSAYNFVKVDIRSDQGMRGYEGIRRNRAGELNSEFEPRVPETSPCYCTHERQPNCSIVLIHFLKSISTSSPERCCSVAVNVQVLEFSSQIFQLLFSSYLYLL